MKFKIIGILGIAFLLTNEIRAQAILNGTVRDYDTGAALPNVLVRISHKRQLAITGKSGNFHISASVNDLLIFTAQGYEPDTLYLVDLSPKKIEMVAATNTLGEVRITASASRASFNPQKEYPEVYEKASLHYRHQGC
jgi:hypothetical protein